MIPEWGHSEEESVLQLTPDEHYFTCPCCNGLGRVLAKDNLATKIERWFLRARADRRHTRFNLVVSPDLASTLAENGVNRVARMMKMHHFKINLVRDTTVSAQEFKVYNAEDNKDLTELYAV